MYDKEFNARLQADPAPFSEYDFGLGAELTEDVLASMPQAFRDRVASLRAGKLAPADQESGARQGPAKPRRQTSV